jgi:hypothetical protein
MRIASRVRRTTIRALVGSLVGGGRHAALSVIVSAIAAAFALTPYVVNREIDGVALLAVGAAMLVASRVARERGALRSLRTLFQTTLAVLVMTGAIALTVTQVGAIELAEIVRVQGGAPWQFNAARHPACAILAIVYGAAIVGLLRTRCASVTATPPVSTKPLATHTALLERAGLLLVAALGVTTFLGGWQLPGISEPRIHGLTLVAGALFLVKTWLTTALLLGASRVATSFTPEALQRLVVRRLVLGLVVAGILVAASRRLVPSSALETAFGATLVALGFVFVVRMTARVRAAVIRPEPHASPFL